MDRASGSGVFARDPDALLDLIELPVSEDLRKQETNNAICIVCEAALRAAGKLGEVSQDDLCSERASIAACETNILGWDGSVVERARKAVEAFTAWRVEGTLREFPKFPPVNVWFSYPVHRLDQAGVLADISLDDDSSGFGKFGRKKSASERKTERKDSIETAFQACSLGGSVTVNDLAEYMGVTEKTVRSRLKEHGGFWVDDGEVGRK